ncbi:hypothetical protein [Pseudoalteromonas rubra]|uniref:hypothetical protein n=1 Tax=Pseudoalteromonas rubra TaxID=43658 RepID=UPI000F7A5825|nr:hypothetical protein [Pseudoalteromonas rubra]
MCSSLDEMRQEAESHVLGETDQDSMSSAQTIHLYSVKFNLVGSFNVTSEPTINSDGELQTIVRAALMTSPSDLVTRVNNAHNSFRMVATTNVPGSATAGPGYRPFNSAWEIARNPSSRDRFDDWVHENETLKYYSTQIASSLGSIFPLDVVLGGFAGMELLFEFEDGSQLKMKAPTVSTGTKLRFTYVAGSATDSDGNPIPDSGTTISGDFQFSSHHKLQKYLEKVAEYGITIRVIDHGNGRVTIREIPNAPQ